MSLMYGAGLISALLGIGSGVLKIPAMDAALRLPIKVSSATSNFMIGVTAAASAGAYFARGDIIPGIAGPVALGSVLGANLGARIVMRSPNEKLRLLFSCWRSKCFSPLSGSCLCEVAREHRATRYATPGTSPREDAQRQHMGGFSADRAWIDAPFRTRLE